VDSLYTLYLSVAPTNNNCRFKLFYLQHHNPRLTNYSQIFFLVQSLRNLLHGTQPSPQ